MNTRERFLKIAHFERKNDIFIPSYEGASPWKETLKRWHKEGLPEEIQNTHYYNNGFLSLAGWTDLSEYLNLDRLEQFNPGLRRGSTLFPPFEYKVLEENERHQIAINEEGVKIKIMKDSPDSMPQWLEYPVRDKKTWEDFKKRLNPYSPERYPSNWEELKKQLNERDYPLGIRAGSFYGFLRDWIGVENLSLMFYDNPKLIEEMEEYLEWFYIETIKKAITEVKFDFAFIWEDMCFNKGPLISPQLFRKFLLPHYKKITDFLRKHGIDIIEVDSDGNLNELIPLWLEGGVNAVFPLEVAAGNDAVALRKKYGKDLILFGNIDKRALSKGKKEIKEEIMRKVPYLISTGGYFPHVDHDIPPDVSWDNVQYYLEVLRSLTQ